MAQAIIKEFQDKKLTKHMLSTDYTYIRLQKSLNYFKIEKFNKHYCILNRVRLTLM